MLSALSLSDTVLGLDLHTLSHLILPLTLQSAATSYSTDAGEDTEKETGFSEDTWFAELGWDIICAWFWNSIFEQRKDMAINYTFLMLFVVT